MLWWMWVILFWLVTNVLIVVALHKGWITFKLRDED